MLPIFDTKKFTEETKIIHIEISENLYISLQNHLEKNEESLRKLFEDFVCALLKN